MGVPAGYAVSALCGGFRQAESSQRKWAERAGGGRASAVNPGGEGSLGRLRRRGRLGICIC